MNYWIFKVDPPGFRVDDLLKSAETDIWWSVKTFKNDIRTGDIVFL